MKVYILFKGWMEDTDFGYSYSAATQGVFSSKEKAQEAKAIAETENVNAEFNFYIEDHDVL